MRSVLLLLMARLLATLSPLLVLRLSAAHTRAEPLVRSFYGLTEGRTRIAHLVMARPAKRKGGGYSDRLAATSLGRVAHETTLGHGGMSPTIGGGRGASAASPPPRKGRAGCWLTSERSQDQLSVNGRNA